MPHALTQLEASAANACLGLQIGRCMMGV